MGDHRDARIGPFHHHQTLAESPPPQKTRRTRPHLITSDIKMTSAVVHSYEVWSWLIARKNWILAVILGFASRVLIATLGHNLDFLNWTINATKLRDGGSVYDGHSPYGYGPIWMFVLRFADLVQQTFPDNRKIFRLVIIMFLGSIDFLIALLISKRFSTNLGMIFFINPISIIITGYHNQFDNLAIVIAIVAIALLGSEQHEKFSRNHFVSLILLGLSLSVKQVLIFFPIWLFFRPAPIQIRFQRLAVAYLLNFLAFVPWATSIESIKTIIRDVYLMRRGRSGILLSLLGADYAGTIHDASYSDLARVLIFIVWIVTLISFGWLMRKKPVMHSLIVYLVLMVALAPAYSQQQLILPLVAVFVYATPELKLFYLLTLLFMIQNSDELGIEFFFPHFFRLNGTIYAWLQVLLILFGLRFVMPKYFLTPKSKYLREALKDS